MSQNIWLTGSRGFIGSQLVKALRDEPFELTCLTHESMNFLDPTDLEKEVDKLGQPDIFIHLGWGQMTDPESPVHLNENVQIAKNLMEILFKRGLKKFIFIGSMNQYGGRIGLLSEDMEPQGRLTNYAKGKNKVEHIGFQLAGKYEKIFISIRTFYVFGAGQRQGSLINDLFQAHLKKTTVSLSPCEHYRDYIHVVDVTQGIRHICTVDESTIVNLGSGKAVQVKDFVVKFWKSLGGDVDQLRFGQRKLRPGEPVQLKSYADLTRLVQLTQWQPQLTLLEGISKTIEGLRDS